MASPRRLQTAGLLTTATFDAEAGFLGITCCCIAVKLGSAQVQTLKNTQYSMGGAMDSAWLCLCGALVMFMHAGFAMLETGSCRAKNASNVLMKNLVNVACLANGRASNFWLSILVYL